MNLTLDDATRAKLGLNLGPPMTGVMSAHVKAPLNKSGADVEVDLAKVEISSPEGAVLKASGKPGKATFTMKTNADGIAIGALAIDAGAMVVRGSAQLTDEAAMQSVKLTQLRLSPGDDLKLDLQGGSTLKATLRGASFDARDVVKAFFSHDATSSGLKDFDLDVKIGAVLGANAQSISQFDLALSRRAGATRSLQASGKLGQGALIARRDEIRRDGRARRGRRRVQQVPRLLQPPRGRRARTRAARRARRDPWNGEPAQLHPARSGAQAHGRRGAVLGLDPQRILRERRIGRS